MGNFHNVDKRGWDVEMRVVLEHFDDRIGRFGFDVILLF